MTITHRARAKSENFSYEGYGSSEQIACDALLAGLRRHARELDTAPEWPDEMIAEAKVHEVAAGCSMFEAYDGQIVRHVAAGSPTSEGIVWRSFCEFRSPRFGWGYVDGYGPTEEAARDILALGMDAMIAEDPESQSRRQQILRDAEAYAVRDGGAYRGGMIKTDGEALLDDHLEPVLPPHSTEWLPTIHCTISIVSPEATLASAEAIARPDRQNRMPLSRFLEEDVGKAIDQVLVCLDGADLRASAIQHLDGCLGQLAAQALFSKRGENLHEEIAFADDLRIVIDFEPRPTTAASLVSKDQAG